MPVVDTVVSANAGSEEHAVDSSAGSGTAAPPASSSVAIAELSASGWPGKISELKKETLLLRASRQRVAKELKAAQRKNKRLKERARCLSEEDMLQILMMKRAKAAEAGSEQSAGSSSSGNPGSAASAPVGTVTQATVPNPPSTGIAERADEEAGGL